MNQKEFEETIYDFGHVMYRLGRMETDEKQGMKEYNQALKKKEELSKIIGEFLKNLN